MGYYIEVPERKGKAQQIVELHGGRILQSAPAFEGAAPDEAIICVVDNGTFEAAAFCYDEREFNVFREPDTLRNPSPPLGVRDMNPIAQRPRTWLLMNRAEACKLTGFVGR